MITSGVLEPHSAENQFFVPITVDATELDKIDRELISPGHGPSDVKGESIVQTSDYISWLDGTMREAVGQGLTMNEAMTLPIPSRFEGLGVVRTEYERSVVHLYQDLEDELFQVIEVNRD